jgi:hypothetical protein
MRLVGVCLFMLAALSAAATQEQIVGWVSDAGCGAEHTKPGGEDCVRKCIRGGEHINPDWKPQKMILVAEDGKTRWTIENPVSLAGLEGKHVRVTAEVHQETMRIIAADIIKGTSK